MSYDHDEYVARVAGMTNQEIVDQVGMAVLGAAVMANSRFNNGTDDDKCGVLLDEACRRGNEDLYQRGFNSAARSQGHHGMCRETPTPLVHGDLTSRANGCSVCGASGDTPCSDGDIAGVRQPRDPHPPRDASPRAKEADHG